MKIILGEVKSIIEWTVGSSFFTLILSVVYHDRPVFTSPASGADIQIEREDEEEVTCSRSSHETSLSLVTHPSTKCNSYKCSVVKLGTAMSYITTCERHLHTHSLHHPPGISEPYLSKHTPSCVPCPSDGIVKKVSLWRVLSAAKIIHCDESVHILKVSTSSLIWNRCFINHLSLQTALCSTTYQPDWKTCWGWQR